MDFDFYEEKGGKKIKLPISWSLRCGLMIIIMLLHLKKKRKKLENIAN